MKKKSEKVTQSEELKKQLATVSTVILSTFQGITVEQDTQLRRSVEAAGGKYQVVKNTVAERAGAGTPPEGLLKNLKGTNSIAYTKTDPVALAKILTKVAKDVPAFQFRAGWVEGRVISIQEIKQLADLPSKEELDQQGDVPAERSGAAHRDGAGSIAAQFGGGDERSGEGQQVCGRRKRSQAGSSARSGSVLTFSGQHSSTAILATVFQFGGG